MLPTYIASSKKKDDMLFNFTAPLKYIPHKDFVIKSNKIECEESSEDFEDSRQDNQRDNLQNNRHDNIQNNRHDNVLEKQNFIQENLQTKHKQPSKLHSKSDSIRSFTEINMEDMKPTRALNKTRTNAVESRRKKYESFLRFNSSDNLLNDALAPEIKDSYYNDP